MSDPQDAMHKGFFAEILTAKPQLFQAILKFNGVSAPLLPESPLPDDLASVKGVNMAALWQTSAFRRRYAPDPAPAGFWDFADEPRRLALLDTPVLQRLCAVFGTAVHAGEIAVVIRKEEVAGLKDALGDDLYLYALERGRYQIGGSVRKLFAERDSRLPLPERISRHGRQALAACCSTWPEALLRAVAQRMRPVMPETAFARLQAGEEAANPAVPSILWFDLKKLLLKEVAPQWAPYFN